MYPNSTLKRFWNKVKVGSPDECWEWQAGLTAAGYGLVWINGKMEYAHRILNEIIDGPIPNGICVCHHCDNPKCVNPLHLFRATHKENMYDAIAKGRLDNNGEKQGNAKLTEKDVLEIRRLYATGKVLQRELAKMWRICRPHISEIVNNKGWKHI